MLKVKKKSFFGVNFGGRFHTLNLRISTCKESHVKWFSKNYNILKNIRNRWGKIKQIHSFLVSGSEKRLRL